MHLFAHQYNQVVEEVEEEELDDDDDFNDRRFFGFLSHSYGAFLAGEDELYAELNEELRHNFGRHRREFGAVE